MSYIETYDGIDVVAIDVRGSKGCCDCAFFDIDNAEGCRHCLPSERNDRCDVIFKVAANVGNDKSSRMKLIAELCEMLSDAADSLYQSSVEADINLAGDIRELLAKARSEK